mgnify:CR=1 FL=1
MILLRAPVDIREPFSNHASLELSCPSACQDQGALLFSLRRLTKRLRKRCLAPQEVPSSGFGYPLDGVSHPNPWKPLSASHAHGLRPSELFSFPVIEKKVSRFLFRSGSFLPNLPGLAPELQRLPPAGKAVPPPASPGVYPGAGPSALLGLTTSQALPSNEPKEKCLSSPLPLSFFLPNGFATARKRNPRGFWLFRLGVSLRRGRRPVWPFSPMVLRSLFGSSPAAGYFFTSGGRLLSRKTNGPS